MTTLELTRELQVEADSLPVAHIDPLSAFDYVLNSDPEATPTLLGANGQRAAFPEVLLDIMRDSVRLLKANYAVGVVARTKYLTTQDAADLIGVSRPTLVSLLESGEIPFEKVGNRRRVKVEDMRAYQERRAVEQRAALDRLAAIGNRDGMYDEDF